MRMTVDQSRKNGELSKVDDLCRIRNRQIFSDRLDRIVVHQDDHILQDLSLDRVDQPARLDRLDNMCYIGRGSGLSGCKTRHQDQQ
jgi:hypothetical protein